MVTRQILFLTSSPAQYSLTSQNFFCFHCLPEGLPQNYSDKIVDVLGRSGYTTQMAGKTDFYYGGHSLMNRFQAWTTYARFPYNMSRGGWNEQPEDPNNQGEGKCVAPQNCQMPMPPKR